MNLDVAPLRRAIDQLESALAYAEAARAGEDGQLALHLRAGTIQAFEFTYELSLKMLRRYLDLVQTVPGESMDFADLVRAGYGAGLLDEEIGVWREFRRRRGLTSHTYEAAKAEEIYLGVPQFLAEARRLLAQLSTRLS